MAAGHPRNILHLRGRLAISPTGMVSAFPHGGTALGMVRDMAFLPNIKTFPIVAEEFGGAVTEVVYEGTAGFFVAVLREWDTDALNTVFPDTFAGGTTGRPVIRGETDTVPGGRLLSSDAVTLLFSPIDIENHPFILIHNAIPVVDSRAEVKLQSGEELGILVAFYAAPNTAGQMYQVGFRRDLVLP